MTDTKKLQEENKKLQEENKKLHKIIKSVQTWMTREVAEQSKRLLKSKTTKITAWVKESFLKENFEEVLASRIQWYFGELLLLNAPKGTIEWITSAEINYYNMMQNPSIDGFAVISAYHKVLDLFIESFITNNFRKFAKKKWCTILRVNDPLEKSLNLIVNSKYIMSVGRLYGLLRILKEDGQLYDYGRCFQAYLEKYTDLKEILLDEDFYTQFTRLNKSEVLSSKRHAGTISKKDTTEARMILIGDFRNQNAMIYKLLSSQSVIY